MSEAGNNIKETLSILVKKTESHVVSRLVLAFFLLLFLLGLSRSSIGGGSSRGSSNTSANVGDQALNVSRLQGLGEEAGPVRLDINTSSLQDGRDFLRSHSNIVVSEDEGGVNASELVSGHFRDFLKCSFRKGLSSKENKQSLVEVNQAIK